MIVRRLILSRKRENAKNIFGKELVRRDRTPILDRNDILHVNVWFELTLTFINHMDACVYY